MANATFAVLDSSRGLGRRQALIHNPYRHNDTS
jgi:hypothetical protein